MIIGKLVRETTDASRVVADFTQWLDPAEGIVAVSAPLIQVDGAVGQGWVSPAFQQQPATTVPDTNTLVVSAPTLVVSNTMVQLMITDGTPGLNYLVTFVVTGDQSGRQQTVEIRVAVKPAYISLPATTVVAAPGSTGAALIPVGTTAQRPDAGNTGEIRFNTTTGQYEGGFGSTWTTFAAGNPTGLLPLTGGTLTGPLVLSADPTTALQPATKQYSDTKLPLAGGILSGPISGPGVNTSASSAQLNIPTPTVADGVGVNWLWGRMRWSGTINAGEAAADSQAGLNKLIGSDAAAVTGVFNAGTLFVMNSAGGNTTSSNTAARNAIHSRIAVVAQNGVTPTIGVPTTFGAFVSNLATAYATASQGGVGGWTAPNAPSNGYYRGSLFAGNDLAWTAGNATNYMYTIGREIDVFTTGSASVYARIGLLVMGFVSTKQADGDCAAIVLGTQSVDGKNWKNGIQFGQTQGNVCDITGSLITIQAPTWPVVRVPAYAVGLDFTAATFSGNALASPGFAVSGTGLVNATTSYSIGGTKVVGARDTGWVAMTGTPDKASTFATSSVTLAQLAGRVMELQAILTTHGLIGT